MLTTFAHWSKGDDIDLKLFRKGVARVKKVRHTAYQLLQTLFQVFITRNMEGGMSEEDRDIFISVVDVLWKLKQRKDEEGGRILLSFLNEQSNEELLINAYPKLLKAIRL